MYTCTYTIVPNDNLYFHDSTNTTIVCVVYDNIYKKGNGEECYTRTYTDEYGQTQFAEYHRDLTSSEMDELVQRLRDQTNVDSVDWGSAMGRTYISVANNDILNAPKIIQALLEKGFRLYMNDGSQLTISLSDVYNQYNQENREKALFNMYKRLKNESNINGKSYWDSVKSTISYQWKCAGRVKLHELQAWLINEFPRENHEDDEWNNFDWNSQNVVQSQPEPSQVPASSSLQPPPPPPSVEDHIVEPQAQSRHEQDEEDDGLCIICYNNERETYLEPCGHIVVCEACSDNLAHDANLVNRTQCVYCRQSIQDILYLKSSKTIHIQKH